MRLRFGLLIGCLVGLPVWAVAQTTVAPTATIQQKLKDNGFDVGPADGIWGTRSIKALEAFQRKKGLPPTGRLDGEVLKRLFNPLAAGPEPISAPPVERPTAVSMPPVVSAQPSPLLERPIPSPSLDAPLASPNLAEPTQALSETPPVVAAPSATPEAASQNSNVILLVIGLILFISICVASIVWSSILKSRRERKLVPMRVGAEEQSSPAAESLPQAASSRSTQQIAVPEQPKELVPPTAAISAEDPLSGALQSYDEALEAALVRHLARPNVANPGDALIVMPIEEIQRAPPEESATPAPAQQDSRKSEGWIPAGSSVAVGKILVSGGMIYVGRSMRRQGDHGEENCLINPELAVGNKADTAGSEMSYWPSYSSMSPASRRAYLDWLAGPRSDASTYIGYVFLYFYGLERRLMFDEPGAERATIMGEVRRLLSVYGDNNGSFKRYATVLLDASSLRDGNTEFVLDFDAARYQVPLRILLALGRKAKDKKPVDPDLLLGFIRTHPETRVLTPAKRALPELSVLFRREVEAAFPNGVRLTGISRLPKLAASYRAASGSFEVDILPDSHGLRDVTGLAEPTATLRKIFDACSHRLDGYSRELGRSDGLKPNLSAVSWLPVELRSDAAAALSGAPLQTLEYLARESTLLTPREFTLRLGLPVLEKPDKAAFREWSRLLGAFGYGLTADPRFTLRRSRPDGSFLIFELGSPMDASASPSASFRTAQLTIALGVNAALADGQMDASERATLERICERTTNLSLAERRRLSAEIAVQTADPLSITELTSLLKNVPQELRGELARVAIELLTTDGNVEAREVAFIEKLFKAIGLDKRDLYAQIHAASAGDLRSRASDFAAGDDGRAGVSPRPLPSGNGGSLDLARLAAIRAETAGASSVLSAIFAEEDETPDAGTTPPVVDVEVGNDLGADGLDSRHQALVSELCSRSEWPRADFERVVRSAGLLPGAAIETLNAWSLDRYDELLIEGEEMIACNLHLLPPDFQRAAA